MNKKIHLPLIIEQDEDMFYIISCPTFKGCHAQGKTMDEAMSRIKEVISMCLEEEESNGITNQFIGIRDIEVAV